MEAEQISRINTAPSYVSPFSITLTLLDSHEKARVGIDDA
jgi:hypothetical protein